MAELDEDIALVQAELDAADHAATDALARFGQHPLQVFRSFYGGLSDGGQSSLEITLRFGVCTRHRAGGQPLSGVALGGTVFVLTLSSHTNDPTRSPPAASDVSRRPRSPTSGPSTPATPSRRQRRCATPDVPCERLTGAAAAGKVRHFRSQVVGPVLLDS